MTTRQGRRVEAELRAGCRWATARLPILVAAAVLAGGCASGGPAAPAAPPSTAAPAAVPTSGGEQAPTAEGALAPPDRASNAFTYNQALAPEGTNVEVHVSSSDRSTEVTLSVEGLLPNRGYAAHA